MTTKHASEQWPILTVGCFRVVASTPSSCLFPSKTVLFSFFCLERNIYVCRPLGPLNYIRVWHDNSGAGASASWFLKYIIVRDLQTMQKFYFICQNWLAVEKNDGTVSPLLFASLPVVMVECRWNVCCRWLARRRRASSRTCCRSRRITVCPKVICGSQSSLVRRRTVSHVCNDARAVSCCY